MRTYYTKKMHPLTDALLTGINTRKYLITINSDSLRTVSTVWWWS